MRLARSKVQDNTVRRILGFFIDKGLLISPNMKPLFSMRISIEDVLWVAENIEPRILEILPAAIIRFPRSFLGIDKIPNELKSIIDQIRLRRDISGTYNGIELEKMAFWADFDLPDRRTKPLRDRKIPRTFRLSSEAAGKLKNFADRQQVTETAILENLIQGLVFYPKTS